MLTIKLSQRAIPVIITQLMAPIGAAKGPRGVNWQGEGHRDSEQVGRAGRCSDSGHPGRHWGSEKDAGQVHRGRAPATPAGHRFRPVRAVSLAWLRGRRICLL